MHKIFRKFFDEIICIRNKMESYIYDSKDKIKILMSEDLTDYDGSKQSVDSTNWQLKM